MGRESPELTEQNVRERQSMDHQVCVREAGATGREQSAGFTEGLGKAKFPSAR